MAEELFGDDGVYSVHWDGEIEAVVVEWADDVGGDTYRECMARVLDVVADRGVTKLLVDSRQQGLMAAADRTWTAEDWESQATDAGLESVAVVYPENRSAKTTVDMSARKSAHTGLERLFTDDLEAARNWLRTK